MSKKKVWTVLRIIISLGLLALAVKLADIGQVAKSLTHFNLVWLLPVLMLILLSVLISALKWGVLVKAQGIRIRFGRLIAYYNCGLFFNNFLPSSIGGDGIRIYLAGKEAENTSAAASSVVMERVIATITLALLGLISSAFVKNPSRIAVVLLAGLLLAGLLLAAILLSGWVPKRLRKRDGKISRSWARFAESAKELRSKKKALGVCLIESVLFQMVVAFVVGAVITGLNHSQLPLPDLFLVTCASSVLAMVPLGINGYGMREGAYIFLLQPYGFAASAALAVSVLFAIAVSAYSLVGGIQWLFISKGKKSIVKSDSSLSQFRDINTP